MLPIVALFIIAAGVAWARGGLPAGDGAEGESRALPVQTSTAKPVEAYERRREFTGELRAKRTSALGFERAARLVTFHVDEGSRVEVGAPLAELDVRRLDAERLRLAAQRAEALAQLEEMKAGPRKEVVAAAKEAVSDLEAQVALLERMLTRRQQLLDENVISAEEFDEITSRLTSVKARLRGARDRVEELEEGTRRERVLAQEARVAQLDAALALLAVDVEDSTLKAPFAGRVLRRSVDEGTVVTPGQPVLTLVEDEVLEAWVGVPPLAASSFEIGSTHDVLVGTKRHPSPLRARLPGTDATTRTQTLVFDLPAGAEGVPGQIVRLALVERVAEAGFWVPASALTRGVRGLWAVYAVETDPSDGRTRAVRHHVEVLHAERERALVRGTIDASSRLIVGNTERIAPGQAVAPVGEGD